MYREHPAGATPTSAVHARYVERAFERAEVGSAGFGVKLAKVIEQRGVNLSDFRRVKRPRELP